MEKDILIIDLYGTLLDVPENKNFTSPLIKDRLLTKENPIVAPYVKRSLLSQRENVSLFEDSYDFLERVSQDFHLICMSNLSNDFIEPFYTNKFDKYIKEVLFSCQLGITKPQPVMYYKVIQKYPQQNIWMVGDNYIHDYLAPRSLGIEAYWLNRGQEVENICPEHQVSSLRDFTIKYERS